MWVLYAYTDTPVIPSFGIAESDQFEGWRAGKPFDYRSIAYFGGEVQCRTEVASQYLKCSECESLMPVEAQVDDTCPNCRFEAVKKAGGSGTLGLTAAIAWAEAWQAEHPQLADRYRVVIAAPGQ